MPLRNRSALLCLPHRWLPLILGEFWAVSVRNSH
ncbi:hypothetical protein SLEP1_g9430 [Rubroshorea leprosula]|uniref:Uncharacterized protein n=1 Tax=Rubroshorea leprosula TaxID=152421 RepID=A0AAV5IE44_9ROSI|nr:hypothetical protein SLEP1_g9430 [Rubroshorea leprosula]